MGIGVRMNRDGHLTIHFPHRSETRNVGGSLRWALHLDGLGLIVLKASPLNILSMINLLGAYRRPWILAHLGQTHLLTSADNVIYKLLVDDAQFILGLLLVFVVLILVINRLLWITLIRRQPSVLGHDSVRFTRQILVWVRHLLVNGLDVELNLQLVRSLLVLTIFYQHFGNFILRINLKKLSSLI